MGVPAGRVRELAERSLAALRDISRTARAPDPGGRTPSDFPLAGLGQADIDRFVGDGRAVADVLPLTPLQAGMVFLALSPRPTRASTWSRRASSSPGCPTPAGWARRGGPPWR